MNSVKTYHLKGGAIIYVLLLSSLISSLFAGLLMVNSYQKLLQNRLYHSSLARENLRSGLELLIHEENPSASQFAFQLYESTDDSLYALGENWGLFKLMHLRAKHKNQEAQKTALLGELIPKNQRYSLHLRDQRQPLTLAGKTSIRGKALLPRAGIRSSYLLGQSFQGEFPDPKINQGQYASSSLYSLSYGKGISRLKSELRAIHLKEKPAETFSLQDLHIQTPWKEKAYNYQTPGSLQVESSSFKGKNTLSSAGSLSIYPSTKLESAILFAKEIIIKAGFEGNLQAFATERIILEKGVKLSYPSLLFVSKLEGSAEIILEEGAELEGALIFEHELFSQKVDRLDYVKVSAGATVRGNVYASHNLDIQGKIAGSVYAGSMILRSPASSYRNHLFNAELDFAALSKSYVAPLIFGQKDMRIIRFLAPIRKEEEEI